jgi:ribosomal protein S18 acetylase RimI-like enzyme
MSAEPLSCALSRPRYNNSAMAARLYPAPYRPSELVDLRRLASRELEPLLREETLTWREQLDWDFEKSADLVRRFVDLRALNGVALLEDGEVGGYLYYVLEENKGLIGDLYVRNALRTPEREGSLLDAALEAIMASPSIVRVESQLMMLKRVPGVPLSSDRYLSVFDRIFMRINLESAPLAENRPRRPARIEKWSDLYQDAASQLIASAYASHIDSRVNDQYRSPAGARRFLYNIVQYPGCGSFYRPASCAAFDPASGALLGLSLASLVAEGCGHITQICVSPQARDTGLGYALLRHSLISLRDMGCNSASLTVTAANHSAVSLYERVGFRTVRRFHAFVWDGF